ncbi:CaiF/GrlA family transcriptional regulator [Salmonella enterica]|nr:CaiF/GrlA family transcriptional regulator [Salmonella enterica]EJN4047970.1 CaiF/GrlA family transcriptional regulator [Salmonella enterica]
MKIKTMTEKNGDNNGDNNVSRVVKRKGVQSNYDDFVIPPGMSEWVNDPLYLIIARWCLQQKRWVSRMEIQTVFHIPARRASFQISYISRKKSRVVCRARYCNSEEGRRQNIELWVEDILPESRNNTGTKNIACSKMKKAQGGRVSSTRLGSGMTGNGCAWEKILKRVREGGSNE